VDGGLPAPRPDPPGAVDRGTGDGSPLGRTDRDRLGDRRADRLAPVVAFAVLFVASLGTLALVRHQGVGLGGDEPYYLAAALAIGRFHSLDMVPAVQYAMAHHMIFPWHLPPGGHIDALASQRPPVVRHGIIFPNHALGLPVLLAVPLLAGTRVALVVLVALLSALAVGAVRLALGAAGVRSPWGYTVVLLFLAPVYLLASTQVYPDLATGLSLAVVLLLVATAETRGRLTTGELAGGAILAALLPWLHPQNAFYVVLLVAAAGVLCARRTLPRSQLVWLVVPTALSIGGLVAFNEWAFGHALGATQGVSLASIDTLTRAAALVVDRRQGLLAGLPIALLGGVTLWLWRRRTPVFVVTCAAVVVATVYGNATQVISFGGGSFIGRFMWPLLPLFLVLAGMYLVQLGAVRPWGVLVVAVVIAVLYGVQAYPILHDEHLYFNQVAWDPARYAGWWGGLDPSPVLGYLGGATMSDHLSVASDGPTSVAAAVGAAHPWQNARNLWGTACVAALSALVVYVLVHLVRRPMGLSARGLAALVGTSVVTLVATWNSGVLLPGTASWAAGSLTGGTGTAQGAGRGVDPVAPAGAVVRGPSWSLLPGRYRATVDYAVVGRRPERGLLTVTALTRSPDRGPRVLAAAPLVAPSSRSTTFTVVRTAPVVIAVTWSGGGLRVDRVALTRTGAQ
jgi:hypothetical protein